MRGKKRLRKKLEKKIIPQNTLAVTLEYCENIPQEDVSQSISRFQFECLHPQGLSFAVKPNSYILNGKINGENDCSITEEHRLAVTDWLFLQEELCSYSVGNLNLS